MLFVACERPTDTTWPQTYEQYCDEVWLVRAEVLGLLAPSDLAGLSTEALASGCAQVRVDLWSAVEHLRGFERAVPILRAQAPDRSVDALGLVLNTPWIPAQEAAVTAATCGTDPANVDAAVFAARQEVDRRLESRLEACRARSWRPSGGG